MDQFPDGLPSASLTCERHLMYAQRKHSSPLSSINRTLLRLGIFLLLSLPVGAQSTTPAASLDPSNSFRWIHEASEPQLWRQIQLAFVDERAPDSPEQGQDSLDVYRYKYIQKVGVLNHSALVIIGQRPAKEITKETARDEYFAAYNFDFATQKKSPIEHAEVMWKWKFIKLAKFGPSSVPDITFTYYTCTECEPEVLFTSLYFDSSKSAWQIRSWGDGNDPWWTAKEGLVVDMDLAASEEVFSFDCIYGILDLKGDGFQNVVMRCKEITLAEKGRAKVDDSTVVFGVSDGQFKPRRVTDPSEYLGLTLKVCKPTMHSWLCRLPGYMTATSEQNHALDMEFPNAAPAARDFAHFRSITKTMSMNDVVHQCGIPDELGGSGIAIFIYHLDDGSLVAIGSTGPTGHLFYANHISPNGKSSEIFSPASQIELSPAVSPQPIKP